MKVFELSPIKYQDEKMFLLDQTLLPRREEYIEVKTKEELWDAIYKLKVRGAPAIGVAAAYGLYVAIRDLKSDSPKEFLAELEAISKYIGSARPTAVNLVWALDKMKRRLSTIYDELGISTGLHLEEAALASEPKCKCQEASWEKQLENIKKQLFAEAERIRIEDENACRKMGEYGLSLLNPGMGILTHCNAGTIATAKYGTCLAPIYLGHTKGYDFKVFADETRPLLQGARLTAWELQKTGVDVTLICDNMASIVMKNGWIDAVVVGCDRMTANGDGANKIGTSGVAILAKEYGIPFYMYVPTSTIDMNTKTGRDIHIEERDGEEIYKLWYKEDMAPKGIKTYNPAFDVTEAKYITAVVTEKGIVYPPYSENLKKILEK